MTVAVLPELCRGATGRLRQKGEADLLQIGKLDEESMPAAIGVHTRFGLHKPH